MNWDTIEARARDAFEPVRETIQTIRYDPPPVPLSRALVGLAVVAAVAAAGVWYVRAERDAWWRAQIAASSASVRAIIESGGEAATATDEDILRGLKDADTKREAAERALADEKTRARDPGRDRCRIPADCLRN